MDGSVMICITTRSPQIQGYFEEMVRKYLPDGKTHLFRHSEFTYVCANCLAANKTSEICRHMARRIPRWQAKDRHVLIQCMLSGNKADFDREALGIAATQTPNVFKQDVVEWMFTRKPIETSRDVEHVFIAFDPNSGIHNQTNKIGSDFAVISGYDVGHEFVVAGAESIYSNTPRDWGPLVCMHIRKLRKRPILKHAMFVVIIENNLGMEAEHIHELFDRENVHSLVYMNEGDLKTGVRTSSLVKREMMIATRTALLNFRLAFDDEFITSGIEVEIKKEFKRQMLAYSEIKETPRNILGHVKVGWKGKLSHGMKDDMSVALQLLIYWKKVFFENARYLPFRTPRR